ncbi:hypothetical protein [Brevibacillus sp. 179-C9.3 HS]|uniref:hypothetical protein n=1 Tax=unclassified Brevibacillus TaxID=2684853 RepID=UPI0039A164B9
MSQMGDSVKLYFSTPDEEGAMAVSSVRKAEAAPQRQAIPVSSTGEPTLAKS